MARSEATAAGERVGREVDARALDADARALDAIDELTADLVELTARLIRVRSVTPGLRSGDPDGGEPDGGEPDGGEAAANAIVGETLRGFGISVSIVELVPRRPNVVGRLPGAGGGRSLVLNGHVDTVPEGERERWSVDPFGGEIRDGRVYGRGAIDDKGGLAAAVIAAGAIARSGVRLRGDLLVHSVVGEELADPEGTRAVLDFGHTADAAINVEPSADLTATRELAIQPVSNGAVLFRATVRGRRTHSALRHEWLYPEASGRPDVGVNALEKGVALVAAIQTLERRWAETKRHPLFPYGKFVLHPGFFHSAPEEGSGPYFPTERCTIEWIVFYHPDETRQEVCDEIAAFVRDWAAGAANDPWLTEHPPELEFYGGIDNFNLDPAHPFVDVGRQAHERVTGRSARVTGFLAGSDATFLSQRGIPTWVYGPGEISLAHAADEYAEVSELVQAAKVYALTALRWCGTEQV